MRSLSTIRITTRRINMRMHTPPHPGKVLREFMGELDVTTAAKHLKVSRATLSRILNGKAGISAEMSLRLAAAFGTHAAIWYQLQTDYHMWRASGKKQPKIEPLTELPEGTLRRVPEGWT